MSTKIYDAYKMNQVNMTELKQFLSELKEKCLEADITRTYSLIGKQIADIVDNVSIAKQEPAIQGLEYNLNEILKGYYMESNKSLHHLLHNKNDKIKIKDMKKSLKNYPALYSPVSMSKDIVFHKMEFAEADNTIHYLEYDMKNTICIFPTTGTSMLVMVFGQAIRNFMYNVISDSSLREFKDTYGIEDYHYQNQCDKPVNISEEEWSQRRNDWDTYMPSGIPRKDGICIEITKKEDIIDNMVFARPLDYISYIPDKEKRVKKYAKDKTITDLLKNVSKEEQMYCFLDYEKMIQDKNPKVMDAFYQNVELFSKILPETTLDFITSGLI